MIKSFILQIYQNPQTVFSLKELSLLFPKTSYSSLKNKIHYALRTKKLKKLRKGIYAKEKFNIFEAVTKIYTPSYISLETVLANQGIIFQESSAIFAVSYLTRKIKISGQNIFYRKIKDSVLLNKVEIRKKEHYFIALKERAFLDAVFLYKDYHFDNLIQLDWAKIDKIVKIYSCKALEKRIKEYYKIYKEEHV